MEMWPAPSCGSWNEDMERWLDWCARFLLSCGPGDGAGDETGETTVLVAVEGGSGCMAGESFGYGCVP